MSGSGISWAICKSAPRSRQITTPTPHPSVCFFLQAGCPSCHPTNSINALKAWIKSWLKQFYLTRQHSNLTVDTYSNFCNVPCVIVWNLSFCVTKQLAVEAAFTCWKEAMQLQSGDWGLHFTRYSGNIFQLSWTGFRSVMCNLFVMLPPKNCSHWLNFDRVVQKVKYGCFFLEHSVEPFLFIWQCLQLCM